MIAALLMVEMAVVVAPHPMAEMVVVAHLLMVAAAVVVGAHLTAVMAGANLF